MGLHGVVHVKGGENLPDRAGGKQKISGKIGVNVHVDGLTIVRLGGDDALVEGFLRHAHHALDFAQQVHQRGDIVGTHVHHRAAAALVVEVRVGMPGLMPMTDHGNIRAHHIADHAVVNELAAGLNACTHEGVRCAADVQVLLFCYGEDFRGFLHVHRQRLFGINVLARQQRGFTHPEMLIGARDVQHHLHLGVCKGFVHILVDFYALAVKALCLLLLDEVMCLLRTLGNQVAHADQLNLAENLCDVFEVNAGNGSAANHSNVNHTNCSSLI